MRSNDGCTGTPAEENLPRKFSDAIIMQPAGHIAYLSDRQSANLFSIISHLFSGRGGELIASLRLAFWSTMQGLDKLWQEEDDGGTSLPSVTLDALTFMPQLPRLAWFPSHGYFIWQDCF